MSHTSYTIQTLIPLSVSFLLLCLFALTPQTADAQVNTVVNGGSGTNAQRQVVTLNSQIRGYLQQLVAKEYELDPNASKLAREAAVKYYEDTKNFIASGDAGNPFFVDNLEVYRAGIRATTTLNTINQLAEEGGLCEAFKGEVIEQLKQMYVQENARTVAQKNTCQLQEADENYEQFLEGDYKEDSIQALFAIMRNPSNTPVGNLLKNDVLVSQQADEAEDNALRRLEYGDGFKDQYSAGQDVMICTKSEQNGIRDNCRIASPAEVIRQRAAGMLNIEAKLIADNDERGEETTAKLIDNAVQQTVTRGITGRANNTPGATSTNPGTNPGPGTTPTTPGGAPIVNTNPGTNPADPIPQVPNDPQQPATQAFLVEVTASLNSGASTSNPIRPVLVRTLTKLQYQLESISLIDRTENRHLDDAENTEYQALACYNLTFPNNFSNDRTLTLTEIPFTIDAVKRLYVLFVQYEEATANNQSTAQILTEFQTLLQNNFAIPTAVDLADIQDKYENFLSDQIASFDRQRSEQVAECERQLRVIACQEQNQNCDSDGYPINNQSQNNQGGR